jgi:hypothetical protein
MIYNRETREGGVDVGAEGQVYCEEGLGYCYIKFSIW